MRLFAADKRSADIRMYNGMRCRAGEPEWEKILMKSLMATVLSTILACAMSAQAADVSPLASVWRAGSAPENSSQEQLFETRPRRHSQSTPALIWSTTVPHFVRCSLTRHTPFAHFSRALSRLARPDRLDQRWHRMTHLTKSQASPSSNPTVEYTNSPTTTSSVKPIRTEKTSNNGAKRYCQRNSAASPPINQSADAARMYRHEINRGNTIVHVSRHSRPCLRSCCLSVHPTGIAHSGHMSSLSPRKLYLHLAHLRSNSITRATLLKVYGASAPRRQF